MLRYAAGHPRRWRLLLAISATLANDGSRPALVSREYLPLPARGCLCSRRVAADLALGGVEAAPSNAEPQRRRPSPAAKKQVCAQTNSPPGASLASHPCPMLRRSSLGHDRSALHLDTEAWAPRELTDRRGGLSESQMCSSWLRG